MDTGNGSTTESVFWKYVTHVPRLDAILLSHVSKTTIPGIRSLIQRKLEEKEEEFPSANLIRGSPDIGNIFINYPGAPNGVKGEKIPEEAESLHFIKHGISKLGYSRNPIIAGKNNDPLTLFSEFGHGSLEMYIIGPYEHQLNDFRKKWPKGEEIDLSHASSSILLIFRQPDKPEVRLMFPGATETAQLASGIEKLRERIKDRSLITCLARPFSTSMNASKARQEEKSRSLSSYRNIRSKVDTSQPKSFSNRSSSLTRPKKSKPVVVQIEISPKDNEKLNKPQKPDPPKRRTIDAPTAASVFASKKSPPVDYSTKALKRTPKKTATSTASKKSKKDPETKARKRPSSIPLKASKIDMQVPPQKNDVNTVENDREAEELKSNPSEVIVSEPKQIALTEETPKTQEIIFSDNSHEPAAKTHDITEPDSEPERAGETEHEQAIIMTAPKLEMTPDSEEPVVVATIPSEIKAMKSSATVEDIKEITDEFVPELVEVKKKNEPAFMEPVSIHRALGEENPGSSHEDLANLNLDKDDNPPVFDSPDQEADFGNLSDQDFMARLVQEGIGKKTENVTTTILEEEESVDNESLETDDFEFSKTSPELNEPAKTPEGKLIDIEQPNNSDQQKSDEKVQAITNLLSKCFSTLENQETEDIEEKMPEPEWNFAAKEAEQKRQRGSLLLTSTVSVESNDYDFFSEGAATVIRKSSEATPTSFSSFFDSNRASTSSADRKDKPRTESLGSKANLTEGWSDEVRSPADGMHGLEKSDNRDSGDGLAASSGADINHVTQKEGFEMWKDVDDVFAGLNEKHRRVSGHSISPNSSVSEEPAVPQPPPVPDRILNEIPIGNTNNNNDSKRGRGRARAFDRPIYVDLTYVPDTTPERLADFSNLVRAKTYVLSSEVANREIFARVLFGIRKWATTDTETTIVSLGDESDADLWSMEYADVLQENNTIVVTSGQVLVDGQAVKLRVDNEHRNFVLTSL
ncbi:Oidioi.mRNA.OKI2018_I69.chr1.g1761.t1.cds [Oikopleura dioica]|uniref:Oidioi.mRNA.OKI2018_I69.chr1.g1761.t1.cds n=1 Tax=Oikopleura dioica TaxID=34765 RepID=A0ABN7SU72_OIKDI|nr:Oidioi.mRNA.OKI2018_I69.chr1.g1761.t1.cds [Oikopleura dioica]